LDGVAATVVAPVFEGLVSGAHELARADASFGPYRIVRELAHGGMGAVYLAERADDQFQKFVALKLLSTWSARDPRRVQRFREERQILAALDHPDIARLLDGGITADGLPWFAMEYVDGAPIDRYCDELGLTIDARLELFTRVCAAVQYAHRCLVVHRDLKPANILVTRDGRVKLLDFGIAKLIGNDPTGELTVPGDRILTPLYASPEQIRGEPVSTASDVYALGVLLHVLLTGRYPYRLSSWEQHEVARAVLEQEPARPSMSIGETGRSPHRDAGVVTLEQIASTRGSTPQRLHRQLHGDLDAVVLKAMEKDVSHRYVTAEQLEADVTRYRVGLPVNARTGAGNRWYHARKFLLRHRVGVGAGAVIALLMLGFTTITAVQAARIRAQAARIAQERDQARSLRVYLSNILQQAVPSPAAYRGVTAREVLDSGAANVERDLAAAPEVRAGAMIEMGQAFRELGDYPRARTLFEKALALWRGLSSTNAVELAQTLNLLGTVLLEQREPANAERAFDEALAIRRRALGGRHGDVARTLDGLAAALRAQGRARDALPLAREALAIDSARGNPEGIAQSLTGFADALLDNSDYARAERVYREALALRRRQVPEAHADIAHTLFGLAGALSGMGERAASDSLLRYGVSLYRRMATVGAPASIERFLPLTRTERSVMRPGRETVRTQTREMFSTATLMTSRIAFVSDREAPDPVGHLGKHVAYVMNSDGTHQRRIAGTEGIEGSPAWSPDATRIAFTRFWGTALDIFLVNPDGGEPVRLTNMTERELGAGNPDWSPDGKQIAFQSYVRPDIYVVNVDGTGVKNLTNHAAVDQQPAWSPDGRKIAFVSRRDGNDEIYIMNADGTAPVRLTVDTAADRAPSWSPDGTRIAFMSERDGNREIYVMAVDGTQIRRLTVNPGEDNNPSWSPDGRQIAFHRRALGHAQIFVMNADGSAPTRLTELSTTSFNGFPAWGPRP
jgi:serine/threonine protein kinase/tetratricopeptide (TPR) repeat protein